MLGVFLDSETNGLNPRKHFLLELAFQIVDLKTKKIFSEYETTIQLAKEEWEQGDLKSLEINGFTWEEIESKGKSKKTIQEEIISLFTANEVVRKKAVFICQNPSFDRAFFSQIIDPDLQEKLAWPYHWLDLASMYFALSFKKAKEEKKTFPWDTGFSKDQIAKHYKLPPENKPHRAMNGVKHLISCYEAVVGFNDSLN